MTPEITPPPELVQQWTNNALLIGPNMGAVCREVATQAARWGADQELEACCALADERLQDGTSLRAARRPKPPSLKELAIRELVDVYNDEKIDGHAYNTIRRALEQLPDDLA